MENSEAAFSLFWQAYPKKQAKGNAEKVWKKLKPNTQLVEIIIQAIEKAKQSNGWKKDDGQYIPLPTSWLNAKRWEDEVSQPKKGGQHDADAFRGTPYKNAAEKYAGVGKIPPPKLDGHTTKIS